MGTVLAVAGLIGLVMFIVFAILWLMTSAPQRVNHWNIAVIGLLIWAVATVIGLLLSLF
jgi:hypothetical protein